MTRREVFATSLGMLASAFNRELAPAAIEGYWIALRDIPEAALARATARALATCRFMPVPAELRRMAGASREVEAEAAQAWDAVVGAVRKYGCYDSVDFGPLVNAVVRNLGGWQRLSDLGGDRLHVWARKDFERVYVALAETDPTTLNGAPLAGMFERRPVRIAIGGKLPPASIQESPTADRAQSRALIGQLADGKDYAG